MVGAFGIIFSIAAILFMRKGFTTSRLLLSVLLLVFHVSASIYYCEYSLTTTADAYAYYYYPLIWKTPGFGLGTTLVASSVLLLRTHFQATYLDCFLLFQSLGFAGIMILARVFTEIEGAVGVPEHRGFIGLLFLPSVNFWTSAIGKDAPLFFAISLCAWAMLKVRRRLLALVVALLIMVLFRAHIALMAAAAMAAASFFGSDISLGRKIGLLAIACVGLAFATNAVESSFNVDVTSASSVSGFFDRQNSIYATVAGTTSVGSAAFPVKLLSLLFRPFFFDASGAMGLITSVENIGGLLAVLFMVRHWRDIGFLAKRVLFVRFILFFALFILLSLTLVYYNVGLGLRQRVMSFPLIFSLLVALWSLGSKRDGQLTVPGPSVRSVGALPPTALGASRQQSASSPR